MNSSPASTIPFVGISIRLLPAFGAFMLGLALFLATGFASPSTIHNATHDTRHSLGLPCH
ncbi:MAG: CbtB-domain containing protein [Bauldia sp.]|nr:CbtB-domain containing protein [Bauldia sp.]